jgi:hypothetical protein
LARFLNCQGPNPVSTGLPNAARGVEKVHVPLARFFTGKFDVIFHAKSMDQ